MRDILSDDGKLKTWDVFKEKNLSLSDYFLLLGVFSAIPPEWKLLLKNEDGTVPDDDVNDITSMWSKSIYSGPWLNESKSLLLLNLSLIAYIIFSTS